jgi:hypothetical protein
VKSITILSLVSIVTPLFIKAQSTEPAGSSSTFIHATKFFVSKPFRDFPDYKPVAGQKEESADKKRRLMHRNTNNVKHAEQDVTDPIRQTEQGNKLGIAPIVNFEGMDLTQYDPPDPNGAVGDSLYVETINVTYAVYNKAGGTVMGSKNLGSLWSGDPQDGDPVVLYDKFADRWFISEFQVTNSPNQLCVAISKTGDPTGAYYVWEFSMGNTYPDYPKYSIWSDGYYVTFQGFNNNTNNANTPQQVGVLERAKMLRGDASAGLILGNLPASPSFAGDNNSLFAAPKTLDCDASALPPFGTPEYLIFFQNIASGGYSNEIILDKLVTDTVHNTLTVTKADSFAVNTFSDYFTNGSLADITQPGDPNGVDALDGTFNFRVPYSRFTGYNSVVMSNTVNLGSMVAGIRWYELRQNDTTQVWTLHQQGTYGPNDGVSRWNGSICQDYNGNIALQYTVASSTVYPGIRYTGRLSTDILGQMTFAEQTAIAGTGTLSGTGGRWGDYSELDIDPTDGLTFWANNEYGTSAANDNQYNRIFSFKLATLTGADGVQDETVLKAYQSGNFLNVKASGLPGNEELRVDLFDISGRQLTTQRVVPVSNMFEAQINVSTLPKGVYFVRIGRENFQRVIKTVIN